MKADGTIVFDPAGWVGVARQKDTTTPKSILFDANDEEVDVDDGSSAPTLRPTASERA